LKIRRREPPGRSDGDRSRARRDQGKPARREGPPSRGKRSSTHGEKDAPPSRPKPGGPRRPASGGSAGTGGGPARRSRDETRERTPPPAAPVLARTGRELLYGRNAVLEALRGRRSIERLFVAEGAREDERLRGLMALATERGAEIDRIPRLMLDDATRGANHQGIALEAEPYRYAEFEDLLAAPGTILVLDHLQDPQNVGTLFRAAEAAGVAGVVIPADRAAGVTPAVVNASAGAVEHLRVTAVPNLARALEAFKGTGRWVAGLDAGSGASNIFATEIPTPTVLVVGAEAAGLGTNLRKHCDLLLALPMRGHVDSLNAATAGAIAIYELLRREGGLANETPPTDKREIA
jgi:23S rRNA (guanosine2251-2'-O)-methyltransferase